MGLIVRGSLELRQGHGLGKSRADREDSSDIQSHNPSCFDARIAAFRHPVVLQTFVEHEEQPPSPDFAS